jgi:hypothetical protein
VGRNDEQSEDGRANTGNDELREWLPIAPDQMALGGSYYSLPGQTHLATSLNLAAQPATRHGFWFA